MTHPSTPNTPHSRGRTIGPSVETTGHLPARKLEARTMSRANDTCTTVCVWARRRSTLCQTLEHCGGFRNNQQRIRRHPAPGGPSDVTCHQQLLPFCSAMFIRQDVARFPSAANSTPMNSTALRSLRYAELGGRHGDQCGQWVVRFLNTGTGVRATDEDHKQSQATGDLLLGCGWEGKDVASARDIALILLPSFLLSSHAPGYETSAWTSADTRPS